MTVVTRKTRAGGSLDLTKPVVTTTPAETFREAFRSYPAGVAVITADAGYGPAGFTATSVISVSADPALLAFSLSKDTSSASTFRDASTVVVHLLDTEDLPLARLCATSGIDRFRDTSLWSRLGTGEPYFLSPRTHLRGVVVERFDVSASTIVLVQVIDAKIGSALPAAASPLVYHNRTWHGLDEHSRV